MNWGMRVMVWGLILIVLVIAAGAVPKTEHEIILFLSLCIVLWSAGTLLWIARTIVRFVMR